MSSRSGWLRRFKKAKGQKNCERCSILIYNMGEKYCISCRERVTEPRPPDRETKSYRGNIVRENRTETKGN